jgi:2'-5' RNA ligase
MFVGVEPTDDVRHGLAAFVDDLLDGSAIPGRTVPPRSWHVTVRFLGATTADQRDRLVGFLGAALGEHEPFRIGFGGLGAFPRPERASVLWLGIDAGTDALSAVAALCEEGAQAVGFTAEDRPFHPHLTLARIRPPRSVADLIEAFGVFPSAQDVDHVALYRSRTTSSGAEYEIVTRIPIGTDARV